jgi:Flp pilus assembly protein TadD
VRPSKHRDTFLLALGLCAAGWLGASCSSTGRDPAGARESSFDDGSGRRPSARTLDSMAHVLAAQGRDGPCEVVLHKLIATHPDYTPAYNELAELYLRHDGLDSAIAVLERGVERAPADPVLLNNLGLCEVLLGRPAEALERFTQAAAASPGDARCRANMALALGLLGRMEEAEALYLQVLPPDEVRHNLSVIAEMRADPRRASKALQGSAAMARPDGR